MLDHDYYKVKDLNPKELYYLEVDTNQPNSLFDYLSRQNMSHFQFIPKDQSKSGNNELVITGFNNFHYRSYLTEEELEFELPLLTKTALDAHFEDITQGLPY